MASFARSLGVLLRLVLRLGWCGVVLLGAANWGVLWVGSRGIVAEMSLLPKDAKALVLGTSPRSARGGGPSPFFEGRMDAAARLYHSGHASHLVLSGDNQTVEYNEPAAMREALRQRGVPESALTLDPGGFRTLESILRARAVFNLQRPIIVTDDFHLPRALFLCASTGLDAVGYASVPVPWRQSYRARGRECLSRVLALEEAFLRAAATPPPAPVG
jgi:SanA protein